MDLTLLCMYYWYTDQSKENHFFIDGDTPRSKTIPILKYETKTKTYSSFEKTVDGKWIEYRITELN